MKGLSGLSGLTGLIASPEGGGGALFSDDFNRANHGSALGNGWVANSGTWGIDGNRAYCSVDNSGLNVATREGVANGYVQVTLSEPGGGSGGTAWVVFRFSDADNFMFGEFSAIDGVKVWKRESGSNSVVASGAVVFPVAGDVARIEFSGSSINVYVDAVLEVATSSAFNASEIRVGMGTDFGIDGQPRWDDYSYGA